MGLQLRQTSLTSVSAFSDEVYVLEQGLGNVGHAYTRGISGSQRSSWLKQGRGDLTEARDVPHLGAPAVMRFQFRPAANRDLVRPQALFDFIETSKQQLNALMRLKIPNLDIPNLYSHPGVVAAYRQSFGGVEFRSRINVADLQKSDNSLRLARPSTIHCQPRHSCSMVGPPWRLRTTSPQETAARLRMLRVFVDATSNRL